MCNSTIGISVQHLFSKHIVNVAGGKLLQDYTAYVRINSVFL